MTISFFLFFLCNHNGWLQIYEERKKLALTLKDTKSVVGLLEGVIGVIVHLLFAIGYLIVFQVSRGRAGLGGRGRRRPAGPQAGQAAGRGGDRPGSAAGRAGRSLQGGRQSNQGATPSVCPFLQRP